MTWKPLADRLTTRVIVYFAANPDDVLRSDDVALKFDVPERELKHIPHKLRIIMLAGMVTSKREYRRSGRLLYTAGPKLLAMLGLLR